MRRRCSLRIDLFQIATVCLKMRVAFRHKLLLLIEVLTNEHHITERTVALSAQHADVHLETLSIIVVQIGCSLSNLGASVLAPSAFDLSVTFLSFCPILILCLWRLGAWRRLHSHDHLFWTVFIAMFKLIVELPIVSFRSSTAPPWNNIIITGNTKLLGDSWFIVFILVWKEPTLEPVCRCIIAARNFVKVSHVF